jgi:hypothetical protein
MKKIGQISIFMIIGIVLVSTFLLFFVFREEIIEEATLKSEENPESILKSCMEDKIKEAIDVISLHGGYVNNKLFKNFKFEGEEAAINIAYLCYNQNDYLSCVNQKPMFLQDLKQEIKNYISNKVESCFNEMTNDFNKEGYETITDYRDFEVELLPKRVIVQTDSEITLTKSGETTKQENSKVQIASRFYEIASVVQELINQETIFCYSENLGIMLLYPDFIIYKFKTGESDMIYTVEHKDSKEKFRFAIRGCAIPPA